MELNAEQIKKALECCTRGRKSKEDRPCLDCPYNECNLVGGTSERQTTGTCQGWLMKDALALINSQEQRIKELAEIVEQSETARGRKESIDNGFSPSVTELQRENERLRAELAEANKDKQILFDEIASLEAESEKAIDIAEDNIRAEIASGGTSCHWCEDKVRAEVARKIFEEIEEGIKAAVFALQFENTPIHRKVKHETYSSLMRFIKTVEEKYTEEGK